VGKRVREENRRRRGRKGFTQIVADEGADERRLLGGECLVRGCLEEP
jgi:hypothetical protein